MRKLLILASLCFACDPAKIKPEKDCTTFDYSFEYHGVPVNCKVLWCEVGYSDTRTGGPTLLYCEAKEDHDHPDQRFGARRFR